MSSFPLSQWSRPGYTPKPGRGKAYTPEEDQFIRDNCGVMTASQIAKELGRCSSGVEKRAVRLRVKFTSGRKRWSVAETDFLIENGSTMTAKQIADALGRTEYAVMERSRYIGGVMRKSGKNHHNHKYSDWDVEMCRKLHDEGLGPKEISDKLDIGYDSVIDFVCYRRR